MITKDNIKNHELIGLKVKTKNMKGLIIDETKNTIILSVKNKEKIIPKKNNEFETKIDGEKIIIKGDELLQKPYNRLKKKQKVKNKWQQK